MGFSSLKDDRLAWFNAVRKNLRRSAIVLKIFRAIFAINAGGYWQEAILSGCVLQGA